MAGLRETWRGRGPLVARSVVFALLVVWIVGGPLVRQGLNVRNEFTKYFRPWIMFAGRGVRVVEVRFFERAADGRLAEIDRFELLGYAGRHEAPRELRLIRSRAETMRVARQLCAQLGRGADVRAWSRRSSRRGWRPEFDGTQRMCTPGAR